MYTKCYLTVRAMDLRRVEIRWGSEKNETIMRTHGVSFDEIEEAIRSGNVVDVFDHPNEARYP